MRKGRKFEGKRRKNQGKTGKTRDLQDKIDHLFLRNRRIIWLIMTLCRNRVSDVGFGFSA